MRIRASVPLSPKLQGFLYGLPEAATSHKCWVDTSYRFWEKLVDSADLGMKDVGFSSLSHSVADVLAKPELLNALNRGDFEKGALGTRVPGRKAAAHSLAPTFAF